MKTKMSFIAMIISLLITCNVNAQQKNLITVHGVGALTFISAKPNMGTGYTVKTETITEEDMGDVYTYKLTTVKNSKGEVAITRTEDYTIEVFSPEFKTAEGIYVGMPISEAVKLMKGKITVFNPNPTRDFAFTVNEKIYFVVSGDDLKGGSAEFDRYYLKPFDVTVRNFKTTAKIRSIRITKN